MAKRKWEITNSPKHKRWFLSIPAAVDAEFYPTIPEIRALAAEKNINQNTLMSDAQLQKNIDKAHESAGEEYSFPVVIETSFDVRIIISPDKTSANLYVRKAADTANPMDVKLISNLVNSSKLKGIDTAKLNATLTEFRKSPAMELIDCKIAEGRHPGRGKNREMLPQFDWLTDEESKKMCAKIAAAFKQGPLSDTSSSTALCESARIAHIIKGTIVYEFSPIEPGTSGIDVYGKEIPGLPGNDPFFQIVENLTISPGGLKADRSGLLIASETDGVLRLRIIEYLDGIATPVITPDNMNVSLILESEKGPGTPLTVELALAALKEKGITGKFDTELIGKTIREVRTTKKSAEIIVLSGVKPVPSGASRIIWHLRLNAESNTANVVPGDRILSLEKLPSGGDGIDVFGTVLKAATGKNEGVPEHDETIIIENQNAVTLYTAGKAGELSIKENKLSVSGTKEHVGDIDDNSGDFSFPGSLVLSGKIASGRTVKAAGTLTVNGDAEAALVSANDSVTMNGGIRGKGKGTVWAKQTVHLTFAENARILAGQDIRIDNYCFQCIVKTNGKLLLKGNPASLLGGTVRASQGVEVFELGSEKTIRTSISFGQNYLVSDQIEVSEKEVQTIKETLQIIDAEMKKTPPTDTRIHELRNKKLELLKKNEKLTVKIFTLKEQFESHVISQVKVENTVYPGVILESHGRYLEVRETKCHVVFIFDQKTGQITCSPIESN